MRSKVLLGVLVLAFSCMAIGTRGVVTGPASPVVGQSAAAMAGWYDWRALKISAQAGDVVIETLYGENYVMIGVINQNPNSAATIIVKTTNSPAASLVIPLSAGEKLWPMPEVNTIVKTGSSDSLIILLQKTK